LDIEEIRQKKIELGVVIRSLLIDFSDQTGVTVEQINFKMFDESDLEGVEFSCTSIDIELGEI
jgi:hypothetical protein